MNQFPQPTRPVESYYDLNPIQPSQNAIAASMDNNSMRDELGFDFPAADRSINELEEEEEEKEAIKEMIIGVVHEWYEKLPDNIRSQINSDRFFVSSSNKDDDHHQKQQQGFKVDQPAATIIRGHKQQLQQEIKHKLERFKIRTVDVNTATSRGVNTGAGDDQHQKLERFKIRTVQLGEVAEGEQEAKH